MKKTKAALGFMGVDMDPKAWGFGGGASTSRTRTTKFRKTLNSIQAEKLYNGKRKTRTR